SLHYALPICPPQAAERHHRAFAKRLEAYDFDFSQLKQVVPFLLSTASRLPLTKTAPILILNPPSNPELLVCLKRTGPPSRSCSVVAGRQNRVFLFFGWEDCSLR